jgi:hypothetical protein
MHRDLHVDAVDERHADSYAVALSSTPFEAP